MSTSLFQAGDVSLINLWMLSYWSWHGSADGCQRTGRGRTRNDGWELAVRHKQGISQLLFFLRVSYTRWDGRVICWGGRLKGNAPLTNKRTLGCYLEVMVFWCLFSGSRTDLLDHETAQIHRMSTAFSIFATPNTALRSIEFTNGYWRVTADLTFRMEYHGVHKTLYGTMCCNYTLWRSIRVN